MHGRNIFNDVGVMTKKQNKDVVDVSFTSDNLDHSISDANGNSSLNASVDSAIDLTAFSPKDAGANSGMDECKRVMDEMLEKAKSRTEEFMNDLYNKQTNILDNFMDELKVDNDDNMNKWKLHLDEKLKSIFKERERSLGKKLMQNREERKGRLRKVKSELEEELKELEETSQKALDGRKEELEKMKSAFFATLKSGHEEEEKEALRSAEHMKRKVAEFLMKKETGEEKRDLMLLSSKRQFEESLLKMKRMTSMCELEKQWKKEKDDIKKKLDEECRKCVMEVGSLQTELNKLKRRFEEVKHDEYDKEMKIEEEIMEDWTNKFNAQQKSHLERMSAIGRNCEVDVEKTSFPSQHFDDIVSLTSNSHEKLTAEQFENFQKGTEEETKHIFQLHEKRMLPNTKKRDVLEKMVSKMKEKTGNKNSHDNTAEEKNESPKNK